MTLLGEVLILLAAGALQEPSAPSAAVEDGAQVVLAATERQRKYLEHNPYHVDVFRDLVDVANTLGALPAVVEHYEARYASSPDDVSARVLLARLLGRAEETERALDLLGDVQGSVEHSLLRSSLLALSGNADAALAEQERALALCTNDADRARVLRATVETCERTGEHARAKAMLLRLAELEPENFAATCDVAERLALVGALDDALRLQERALDLAGDDVVRRTHALAALGRSLEASRRGGEALARYEEAVALLGHGHWLRAELFARVVDLRGVSGTLEPLLGALRNGAERTGQVAAWLDLAHALEQAERPADALAVALEARREHDADAQLGELIVRVAEKAELTEGVVAEWQRRARVAPEDSSVQAALAVALAEAGESEAAERALRRSEQLAQDTAALLQVRSAWAALERPAEHARVLHRIAELDPEDVAPWIELARLAADREDRPAAIAALEEAEYRASAESVVQVADAWREHDELARARQLLERAAQDVSVGSTVFERLIDVLFALDEDDEARRQLRALAARSSGTGRSHAVKRLASRVIGAPGAHEWVAEERLRLERSPESPLPSLILAHFASRARTADRSVRHFRDYLALVPDDTAARSDLVTELAQADQRSIALAELDVLIALEPGNAVRHTLRKAELARAPSHRADALGWLANVRRATHEDAAQLRRIAACYDAWGETARAIEALEAVMRLQPDDAASALQLGRLSAEEGDTERASERLQQAWRCGKNENDRASIARELYGLLVEADQRVEGVDRLIERARSDPYDAAAPDLALTLLFEDRRFEAAAALIDVLLERRPERDEWRVLRSRARLAMGTADEADLRHIIAAGGDDAAAIIRDVERCGHRQTLVALGG